MRSVAKQGRCGMCEKLLLQRGRAAALSGHGVNCAPAI